jgi:hypothetical protein
MCALSFWSQEKYPIPQKTARFKKNWKFYFKSVYSVFRGVWINECSFFTMQQFESSAMHRLVALESYSKD